MAFEIKESYIKPMEAIEVGSTVRLSCKSDDHYEYCVWRHRNRVCNFEWKKAHGSVKKQICTELDNRAIFRGDYNSHECAIDLTNVQLSDNGEWSCEMESYVWGIVRGYTHKKSLNLRVVKEITTPATTLYVSHEQTENDSTAYLPGLGRFLQFEFRSQTIHKVRIKSILCLGQQTLVLHLVLSDFNQAIWP